MFPLSLIETITALLQTSSLKYLFCRHDMARKRKTTQSSKTGCVMETSAASGCVLQSYKKQMTPMTTSMSTPSKASAQQLLASDDGGAQKEKFCTMVQTLEGIVPFSTVTADNDPHSEVLSGGNFDVPKGGYPAPYVPENFQGLFIPKPGAPGILTCGYHCNSLRDHPLHCQGHSYTEGSDRVGMYPTQLGLVETGVGYTETMCIIRRGKARHCTAVRKYSDFFKQSGYQAATVDTWGGLHFLPLIMSVFLVMRRAPL